MAKKCMVQLFIASACLMAWAQQSAPKIEDIKRQPRIYVNEVVTITGYATQWKDTGSRTTNFYYFKDDWGGIIKVRTTGDFPDVGLRYVVRGPVSMENQEPYIAEEQRDLVNLAPEPAETTATPAETMPAPATPTEAPVPVEPLEEGLSQTELYLIIGIGVAVVFLVAILLAVFLSRKKSIPALDPLSAAAPAAEAQSPAGEGIVTEGKTIKIQAPPPGTLKLLPGRFTVVKGDDTVKEIRFYRPKGKSTPEITFGRAKGPAYTHVQLKPMTVSSRQAKLIFTGEQVMLVNYPGEDSNPTQINGRPMTVEESAALSDRDEITMGEVVFRYEKS